MRRLNSYKLLLVLITGLFVSPQAALANHDTNKPDPTVTVGQYSVSDNFKTLGKPADIGC